ncbi:hypothetical protein MAPG_05923 [Magnaporthiopsis poae ATCC 64411]|uniref:Uncharacterized protein n=1 Tax=Magnaporthiopsis poae (strain ATCC 64411 / 73-15) TaxID=644358 RepID=A0A0C4E0P2_MAGP6|nr:hypothetical protein MAPG_05923 [Magnaporthiopsis poae ATCC 64411]
MIVCIATSGIDPDGRRSTHSLLPFSSLLFSFVGRRDLVFFLATCTLIYIGRHRTTSAHLLPTQASPPKMQLLRAVLLLAASALVSAAPPAAPPAAGAAAGTPGAVTRPPGEVAGTPGAGAGAGAGTPRGRGRPNNRNGQPNNQAPGANPNPPPAAARPAAGAAISPDLVPAFGVERGVNADARQRGSCDGANGVLISCSCPPDRAAFIAKLSDAVAQGSVFGTPITFDRDPANQSPAANKDRATAMLVVLQSFDGAKGVGCPGAAAPNFVAQQRTGVRSR